MDKGFFNDVDFQTPLLVCEYMVSMIDITLKRDILVLEPTPGKGYLVGAIAEKGFTVMYPDKYQNFWDIKWNEVLPKDTRFDYVLMNPPFNPIDEMERFVTAAMQYADRSIILLHWNYIINSERRLNQLISFGLVSVTALPRKTFPKARVQTCIIELRRGYLAETKFKTFNF